MHRMHDRSAAHAHLHNKSMSTMPPVSIVSGRCNCSSCSTVSMDFPIPPACETPVRRNAQSPNLVAQPRTVHANDALLNHGRERHPVEHVIETLPSPEAALLA